MQRTMVGRYCQDARFFPFLFGELRIRVRMTESTLSSVLLRQRHLVGGGDWPAAPAWPQVGDFPWGNLASLENVGAGLKPAPTKPVFPTIFCLWRC